RHPYRLQPLPPGPGCRLGPRRVHALVRGAHGASGAGPCGRVGLGAAGSARAPYWQAAAGALLAPWIYHLPVVEGVRRQPTHARRLVRYYAVQALAPLAVQGVARVLEVLGPRLEDSARAVRVAAAWALRVRCQPCRRPAGNCGSYSWYRSTSPLGRHRPDC